MIDTYGYALTEAKGKMSSFKFKRRSPNDDDIVLEILFCGICHSDILLAKNGLGNSKFPMVPGHEIVGRVVDAGSAVSKFKKGDIAGIGCIVDSCGVCSSCNSHDEHYCVEGMVSSFGGRERGTGETTRGGYSKHYVIKEDYAISIPKDANLAAVAPLLCGGVTTYAPLKRFGIGKGQRVGVLGLGGLGHLAIKFAKVMGATPVMLTSSESKVGDAQKLGAEDVILTGDEAQMKAGVGSLDFILNTISAPHNPNPYLGLLKRGGTMCLVGMPESALAVYPSSIIFGDKCMAGSLIGGIQITQEMMDFSVKNGVMADIEMIDIYYVNKAWERMEKSDVKYRFVIDMGSLQKS